MISSKHSKPILRLAHPLSAREHVSPSAEQRAIVGLKRELRTVRGHLRGSREENERLRAALMKLLVSWMMLIARRAKALPELGIATPEALLNAVRQYDENQFNELISAIDRLAVEGNQ